MNIFRRVALASVAATTVAVGIGAGYAVASSSSGSAAKPAVSAGPLAPAHKKVKPAWQGDAIYAVPTGLGNLFYHYPCPTGQIALSGSFHESTDAGVLNGSFPRTDITPLYSQWGWVINWPSGAPAVETITFNVYCTK
jgi:hypothetical protein